MTTLLKVPRVGVSAVIQNSVGKFLVSKRKGSHGAGSWQFPGGHLEMEEEPNDCAVRETEEETGLKVTGTGVIALTNDVFKAEKEEDVKHYITIFIECIMVNPSDEPKHMEKGKCEGWHWKSWEELMELNLFLPLANLSSQTSNIHDLIKSRRL
ncbi:nudix domain-containing protein [Trichoderma barbatum]